jgi:hypothetical protein
VNDKLEIIRTEAEVTYSGTIPVFFLQRLRKITEKLQSEYHVPWPKFKLSTSDYKSTSLPLRRVHITRARVTRYARE